MRSVFDRHDFSFKWSYAEMTPLVVGHGYDWTVQQTAKCIDELVALIDPDAGDDNGRNLFEASEATRPSRAPITITCKPADSLDHINDGSVDAIVMDPPYYDNVMYAELSDFFYVWLKRTAGRAFSRTLPAAAHRQRERGGRQSGQVFPGNAARAPSPAGTTGSGWRRSLPSAVEC